MQKLNRAKSKSQQVYSRPSYLSAETNGKLFSADSFRLVVPSKPSEPVCCEHCIAEQFVELWKTGSEFA